MPDAKTARISVVWAMVIIGSFYIMTTFLGFGAATIVGKAFIAQNGGINMSAPLLAQRLAGDVFFAFISADRVRHDPGRGRRTDHQRVHVLRARFLHQRDPPRQAAEAPGEEVRVARITAFVVGAVSIAIAILLGPAFNVAFLVGLAFAVAASANLPVIVLLDLLEALQHRRARSRVSATGLLSFAAC